MGQVSRGCGTTWQTITRHLIPFVGAKTGRPSPHQATVEFAGPLHKDLEDTLRIGKDQCASAEEKLMGRLLDASLTHVNFYRVAAALLNRFAPLRVRPMVIPSVN